MPFTTHTHVYCSLVSMYMLTVHFALDTQINSAKDVGAVSVEISPRSHEQVQCPRTRYTYTVQSAAINSDLQRAHVQLN